MPRKKMLTLSWLFRLYGQKMAIASWFLPILAAILFHPSAVGAAIPDDSYIAGYAAGALKRDFKLDLSSLIVRNGVITVPVGDLTPEDRTRILQILSEIPGVTGMIALEGTGEQAIAAATNPQTMQAADKGPDHANQQIIADPATPGTPSAPESPPETVFATGFLPTGHLFKPLLADPR